MKLVGHLSALGAVRAAVEETAPEVGVTQAELVQSIREAYDFQGFPQFDSEPGIYAQLPFSEGRLTKGGVEFVISQLVLEQDSIIVQTTTTDQADLFLQEITSFLEKSLGFRFSSADKDLIYVSNVVVEFGSSIESFVDKLDEVVKLMRGTVFPTENVSIKRISFGEPTMKQRSGQFETLQSTDFTIERRVREPFEKNRFYSSAPMRTEKHIEILERIEKALSS